MGVSQIVIREVYAFHHHAQGDHEKVGGNAYQQPIDDGQCQGEFEGNGGALSAYAADFDAAP